MILWIQISFGGKNMAVSWCVGSFFLFPRRPCFSLLEAASNVFLCRKCLELWVIEILCDRGCFVTTCHTLHFIVIQMISLCTLSFLKYSVVVFYFCLHGSIFHGNIVCISFYSPLYFTCFF